MNHSSPRFLPSSRLLLALLTCLPLGSACSEDDAAPVKPTTFGVVISSLDGNAPEKPVALRCDQGGASLADGGAGGAAPAVGAFSTLVVGVTLSPDALSSTHFVLRPAHACGSSKRCGYVRIEGLDDAGQVVASVDTVTTEGVLQLNFGALPTELRATLISGVDQSILKNPDKTEVTTSVTPSFVVPAACGETSNNGGAGGDGGAATTPGGAGPGGAGGDANLGGAAGDASLGGAAGDASLGGAGGLNSAGNGGDGG